MYRRVVSLITLVAFLALLPGCHSSRAVSLPELMDKPGARIATVVMKDGTVCEYEATPAGAGRLVGNVITCGRYAVCCPDIPLEEVDTVYISYTDPVKSTVCVIGVATAVAGTLFLIALAMKESCPFVYSFDGEQYVFDGEPYGGAVCPALQRTDLCSLEHLRPHDGQYLLQMVNEVDETQYTDEFKLWVVDHPPGTQVFPDDSGELHTVERPLRPIEAREGASRDVALWLSEKDPRVWESDIRSKDPEVEADLRDTLTFVFPKPEDATTAKLIVNGCNSLWCSQMLRRFLELNGYRAELMLERMDDPSTLAAVTGFFYREEFFFLKVKVWVDGEWIERGRIMGGGPFISEDRVVPLDVEDISGTELRVQLVPPAGFWRFDWFAVDYSDDLPLQLQEVAATSIEGDDGADLCDALGASDGTYHVMPEVGERALLAFPVPPVEPGSERTVFAKVAGYYDIHLHSTGRPRTQVVDRILEEPGYVVSYSLTEYKDWQSRLEERATQGR